MKTLLAFLPLTLAVVCDATRSSSLPHPWLSLDRSAKVLRLVCTPPPEALDPTSAWQYVDGLRLLAFLPQHSFVSNVSLVDMTSSLKEPRANPKFSISRTSFHGMWSSKSVSLEFLLPVTNKELGHYFCEVFYRDNNDQARTFATRAAVDKNFVFSHFKSKPKTEQNFEVSVSDAHKVRVTWSKPEQSGFTQASVSFELVGESGQSLSPSRFLFATDGDTDSKYGSEVLLKKVNPQDGKNMSIVLFVKRDEQTPDCHYSCWVPYPACKGENEVLCTCGQQGSYPLRQVRPPAAGSAHTYRSKYIVFAVLSVIMFLLLAGCVIVYVLFKTGRCSKSTFLQKVFSARRETVSGEKLSPEKHGPGSQEQDHTKQISPLLSRIESPRSPLGLKDKERDKSAGDDNRGKDRGANRSHKTRARAGDDDLDNEQPLRVAVTHSPDTYTTSGSVASDLDIHIREILNWEEAVKVAY